jgi:nucleotide-binding universal stress UspA family protein
MSADKNGKAPRIVIGVDGSASSLAALRWALQQAKLTGGTVDAVVAWQMPAAMTGFGFAPVAVADGSEMEQTAQRVLDQAVSKVASPEGGPVVRTLAVQGFPAAVLLGASAGADLLVLGSRGHGGFSGALLGSVGQHCVRHAHCPVVIVRGEAAAQAA